MIQGSVREKMVLKSDLSLDKALFDPANVTEETKAFNEFVRGTHEGPKWVDVSLPSSVTPYTYCFLRTIAWLHLPRLRGGGSGY